MKCFETCLIEFPAAAQFSFSQKLLGQASEGLGFHGDQWIARTRWLHKTFNLGYAGDSLKRSKCLPLSPAIQVFCWDRFERDVFPKTLHLMAVSAQGRGQRGSRKRAGLPLLSAVLAESTWGTNDIIICADLHLLKTAS